MIRSESQRLAHSIALSDSFQVCFVVGPAEASRDLVASALAEAASFTGEPLILEWAETADRLLDDHPPERPRRGVIVIDFETEAKATDNLRVLNVQRDSLAKLGATTLVLILREAFASAAAHQAPDLWSIRSLTLSAGKDHPSTLDEWVAAGESALEARIAEKPEMRARYEHGSYIFSYAVRTEVRPLTLRELLHVMSGIGGWTGWRPWWVPTREGDAPYASDDGVLECWMAAEDSMFPDPAHSDFWRASPTGSFFLLRGYDEDSTEKLAPGTRSSMGLPVWRAGEALFHAQQMATELVGGFAVIDFTAVWRGLAGRQPTDWPGGWATARDGGTTTRRRQVSSAIRTHADAIAADLPAVVHRLLQPLYDAFLETRSPEYVRRQIDEMRTRAVRH